MSIDDWIIFEITYIHNVFSDLKKDKLYDNYFFIKNESKNSCCTALLNIFYDIDKIKSNKSINKYLSKKRMKSFNYITNLMIDDILYLTPSNIPLGIIHYLNDTFKIILMIKSVIPITPLKNISEFKKYYDIALSDIVYYNEVKTEYLKLLKSK